jgi:hypothetical protein
MNGKRMLLSAGIAVALAVVCRFAASAPQTATPSTTPDKYTAKVPGGLAFSEFRGYENWQLIAVSQHGEEFHAILGNPAMIAAYQAGIPDNGKPFPNGAAMAKIHWYSKIAGNEPGQPRLIDTEHNVEFMVKDSKRFADSGGWGYGLFDYDVASNAFRPGDLKDTPPQANDAKCGYACHTVVQSRDFVFTRYATR